MTTAREEVLCPYCNHSYTRRGKLPIVGEGETYPDLNRRDCKHLIAHPDDYPQWGKDLLAAFLKHYNYEFDRKWGINVEKLHWEELERQRAHLESIIRQRIKEVDGFFFVKNKDLDIPDLISELRPILIGLQSAGS